MYLVYVDESGDVGQQPGSTRYFALSGLVVHELEWHSSLELVLDFRRDLRVRYGLKLREEIHAAKFIHHPGELQRIRKDLRLRILREVLDFQALNLKSINIINIVIDKQGKSANFDVFNYAWMVLLQRFENTMLYKNFPGPQNPKDYGLVVADRTDEKKLRLLARKLRRYNPVPQAGGGGYKMFPNQTLIEDPVHRDSVHSYLIQLADVNAYFLYQKILPNGYIQKKGARNWFDRLDPVLCKVACKTHPQGIVRL